MGDGGTVLSCTTAGCTDLTATFGVTTRLNSVATSKGLVFVVGDGGTSLSYRSSDGNVIDGSDATLGDLISVSAVDDGDADPFTMLFALSGQGVVLHRTVGVWP